MLRASEDLHTATNNPSSTAAACTELSLCSSRKNFVIFWIKQTNKQCVFDIAESPHPNPRLVLMI